MNGNFFIQELDFERAKPVANFADDISELQKEILKTVKQFEVDEVYFCDDFPAVFIKYVQDFGQSTLEKIAEIHHKAWNYKQVLQLFVISEIEIRVYNCAEKPIFLSKNTNYEKETQKLELYRCSKTDKEKLDTLNKVFSRIAVDIGILWTSEEAIEIRKKINIQRRVDKYLISSLVKLAERLKDNGLENINLVHKLIMRSLFLLYLEDRDATDKKFYKLIQENATSYFDILTDLDATYRLFHELESRFNGNLFIVDSDEKEYVNTKHLSYIKKCFKSGIDDLNQASLFEDWRLFKFDIIQIELLSEIYENFLSVIDKRKKDDTGTYYTPPSLVELILNEKLSTKGNTDYNFKILDPACGSGIFLVESFKRLVKRYENNYNKKLTEYETLKNLLVDNIYGIEIDNKSIKVAAFSLYLALLENLNPKTLWQDKILPNLINDPEDRDIKQQGKNLYRRDTILKNEEIESIDFNLVIGNPPFGTKNLSESIRSYCNKYGIAQEMVLPFLHKAVTFSPNGEIALIFNTKVLTNTKATYQNFRRWLFNECYVEKIYNFSILRKASKNFGGQLFGSAISPICIVFYRKEAPNDIVNDKILYYAPKTYIKMNVVEGVVIDSTDIKYLPREECSKPDSTIWKTAMWGGTEDIKLLKKLIKENTPLKDIKSLKYGVGLELSQPLDKPNKEIKLLPHHTPKTIQKFYTNTDCAKSIDNELFRRIGNSKAYSAPHVLLNEGIQNQSITASYLDYNCSFYKGIVGFYSTDKDEDLLKLLCAFLNSSFVIYYAFLTTSSWGIERDVVKHQELVNVPFILNNLDSKTKGELIELIDEALHNNSTSMKYDNIEIKEKIDKIILGGLTDEERQVILDSLDNLDLFFKGNKSRALNPIQDFVPYAKKVVQEINDFLIDVDLKISATIYHVTRDTPLSLVKLTFSNSSKEVNPSSEDVNVELKRLDRRLYDRKAENIYFRKKMNYYDGNEIYIIRPNQKRFWSQTMAIEDASELIIEILNMR